VVLLPSYSADLNPIEQAFSKIKNIPRNLVRAPTKLSWRRWRRRSLRSLLLTPLGGSITVATRLRFSTYECRCKTLRVPGQPRSSSGSTKCMSFLSALAKTFSMSGGPSGGSNVAMSLTGTPTSRKKRS
jgi:hypothetical protein